MPSRCSPAGKHRKSCNITDEIYLRDHGSCRGLSWHRVKYVGKLQSAESTAAQLPQGESIGQRGWASGSLGTSLVYAGRQQCVHPRAYSASFTPSRWIALSKPHHDANNQSNQDWRERSRVHHRNALPQAAPPRQTGGPQIRVLVLPVGQWTQTSAPNSLLSLV